jgi:hypothetical protein
MEIVFWCVFAAMVLACGFLASSVIDMEFKLGDWYGD